MQKCLLISFTFSKINDGYSPIPYSISSILAAFKNSDFVNIELCLYNINEYFENSAIKTEARIIDEFNKKYLNKINDYSFVAISAYTWSENLVNELMKKLKQIFIEENGCNNYRGFPLRLPQNSEIKKNAVELKIKAEYSPFHAFPIKYVTESYSFTRLDWEIMYSFANAKKEKENYTHIPVPQAFIPIMKKWF